MIVNVSTGLKIVVALILIATIASMFIMIEVTHDRYNGWLCRGIKHFKCGAIHGHVYHNGECLRCGKQEHQEKRHE